MAELEIKNGKFHIDGMASNPGNPDSEGKLIGVCSDVCAFFDAGVADVEKNREEFIKDLDDWRNSGVNLVTLGLQSPNPFGEYYKKAREQDKSKNISFESSAINPDGSLNSVYLEYAAKIIEAAKRAGLAVFVNIFSSSCEDMFEDEFAIVNGAFNVADWLLEKKFPNVMANVTDVSHTFYKSSVLSGGGAIKILKSLKEKAGKKLILGAGLKSTKNIPEGLMGEYMESSDFIPIYSNAENAKSEYNTKKMIGDIHRFKKAMAQKGANIPIIVAKGDDLSERYNSYGKNNLAEALENGASWCYYDKQGFVLLPVNWDKNSSAEKSNFFRTVENIRNK
ncbi:MAG: hypothetical protein FWG34_05920 [Oscillospiraceae bacterium]|nr:hypothetical protein [Oscillospiraceae bacterium]